MASWDWVLGQFDGREYWGTKESVRVRRECWPAGWRIWKPDDLGYLCQGYGNQIGAAAKDYFITVAGKRVHDGATYTLSAEDLAATDWERIP